MRKWVFWLSAPVVTAFCLGCGGGSNLGEGMPADASSTPPPQLPGMDVDAKAIQKKGAKP